MKFKEWFDAQDLTQAALGQRLHITQGRVWQLLTGGTPSWALAARIQDVTKGQVAPNDWLEKPEET